MWPSAPSITSRRHVRVQNHDGARDGRHARGQHDEELRARQVFQIRTNDERRFDHAEEHARPGADSHRTANAEGMAQYPGKSADDGGQDSPVPRECDQHAEHDDLRQDTEPEDVHRVRVGEIERRIAAAEKAEHERRARARGCLDRIDDVIGQQQRVAHRREAQQRDRQHELQRESHRDVRAR